MKNLITAAIIAMTATAAQADTASDFAECVAGRIAAENGLTLEAARASFPDVTRNAEINFAMMASVYLKLPTSVKPQGVAIMVTEVPQSATCLHTLDR